MDRCPDCGSDNIYFSKKRQVYVCEDCELEFAEERPEIQSKTIFFSYAHDENEWLVQKLKGDIEQRGHKVWIDRSEIKSGDDWRQSITEGILSSSGVIAFLSKHSVRIPGVCLDELRIALSVKNGNIKTVLLEDESEVSPPTSVSGIQWLDMSCWKSMRTNREKDWDAWYNNKLNEIIRVIEDESFASFSGDIENIKRTFDISLSDTKEQMLISHTFVGRRWLSEMLEEWRLNDSSSRVFILYGGPGIGKSTFAAHQIHYNPHVMCGFFCEWDKDGQRITRNVIKNISYKLTTRLPEEMENTDKVELLERFRDLPECADPYKQSDFRNRLIQALEKVAITTNDCDPEHNYLIGLAYRDGIDVEVDRQRGLELIKNAAEAGWAEAASELTAMYYYGFYVKKDYE